uniref:Uncharacterized protein n=1 Tax=Oryza brachyantha TaxID=4533 RepID=J3L5P7_ORYBR
MSIFSAQECADSVVYYIHRENWKLILYSWIGSNNFVRLFILNLIDLEDVKVAVLDMPHAKILR